MAVHHYACFRDMCCTLATIVVGPSGLPLFILLPGALEAMKTTVGLQIPEKIHEAE